MKKKRKCCLCGAQFRQGEWGNSPEPIRPYSSGLCCDKCFHDKVLVARLAQASKTKEGIGIKIKCKK